MPLTVFAMLVFGICTLLAAGSVEAVMRDFAGEVGVSTLVFIVVPALFAMLFTLLLYRKAVIEIKDIKQSLSRAVPVAIFTWLAVTLYVSWLWCPGYRLLSCTRDVALVTGIIGGGPLLIATLIAGAVVGGVLKRRVDWLSYQSPARKIAE
jgi:hypothetical protein